MIHIPIYIPVYQYAPYKNLMNYGGQQWTTTNLINQQPQLQSLWQMWSAFPGKKIGNCILSILPRNNRVQDTKDNTIYPPDHPSPTLLRVYTLSESIFHPLLLSLPYPLGLLCSFLFIKYVYLNPCLMICFQDIKSQTSVILILFT